MQIHHVTIHELVNEVRISIGSVHTILCGDLLMRVFHAEAANFGAKALQDMLDCVNGDHR